MLLIGAKVHLLCRNETKGQEALDSISNKIRSHTRDCKDMLPSLHIVDMSDLASIARFVKKLDHPVDVLINNAGVLLSKYSHVEIDKTKDPSEKNQVELTFATNTLGPYALTEWLLKKDLISSGGRVIMVTSAGMLTEDLVNPLNSSVSKADKNFDGTRAYAQTKRQEVALVEHWTSKYTKSNNDLVNAAFYAVHPGWVDTPGVKNSLPSFYNQMKSMLRTVQQGADSIIWTASIDAKSLPRSGAFMEDRKEVPKHLPLVNTEYEKEDVDELASYLDHLIAPYEP